MQQQRGFVLLQVMLAFSILVIIVAQLQYKQRVQIERTRHSLFMSEGQAEIDGFIAIAVVGLAFDAQDNQTDHFYELWNRPIQVNMHGWDVVAELNDLQGRFNVNWLSPKNPNRNGAKKAFEKLLNLLEVKEPALVTTELYNWMDKDSGIDFDYSDLDRPYAPSFHELADVSELLLLKSVDREQYDLIFPYVSALPFNSKLNINTASDYLLMSIAGFIDAATAKDAIATRDKKEKGFASVDDFTKMSVFTQNKNNPTNIPLNELTLSSEWFSLFLNVELEEKPMYQRVILHRNGAGIVTLTLRDRSVNESNTSPGDPLKSGDSNTQQSTTANSGAQSDNVQSNSGGQ